MRAGTLVLLFVLLAAGCGPAERPAGPGFPRRIVTAIQGELSTLAGPGAAVPGREAVADLVNTGMINFDNHGTLIPRLAEAVPSIENGLWRVFPDGRMETTWHIREGARWQDGQPLTADDLAFTAQLWRDPELPVLGHIAFGSIDSVEAMDARTVTVSWKKP